MRTGLLHNRPLAALCLAFLVGLITTSFTEETVGLLPGLLAVIFLLSVPFMRFLPIAVRPDARRRLLMALLAGALILGLLFGLANASYFSSFAEETDRTVSLTVRVDEVVYAGEYSSSLRGEVLTLNGEKRSGRIAWETEEAVAVKAGDTVAFDATVLSIHDTRVASDAIWLQADGVAAVGVDVENFAYISSNPTPLDSLRESIYGIRASLSRHLTGHIEGDGGALLSAMLLGERDTLSPSVRRDMQRVGLSHILSISGLHLGVLVGFMHILLSHARIKRTAGATLEICAILFYMALTGFPLSVVRAGVMLILALLSFYVAREPDGITSLFFAATFICILSRFSVYDGGLWLSVCATFGILTVGEYFFRRREEKQMGRMRRFLLGVRDATLVSLGALFATLPLSALLFAEFSLLSLPANLLLAPLFSLYLLLGLPALLLCPLAPVSACMSFCGNTLLSAVSAASSLRGCVVSLDFPAVLPLTVLTAVAVFVLLCTSLPRRFAALAGSVGLLAVVFCVAISGSLARADDLVYYRTDGKNDSFLAVSDGKGYLFDMSNTAYAAMSDGFDLADEAGLTEIEGYILTHYHARHPDTFAKLAARHLIRRLYLPAPRNTDEEVVYLRMLEAAKAAGVESATYKPYDSLALGRLTLIPHRLGKSESTHPTVGLTLRLGERYLLTYLGKNAHESDTKETAASAVANSPILIFGTHGSAEKTKINFYHFSADLALAVIMQGENRLPDNLLKTLTARAKVYTETTTLRIDLNELEAEEV